MKKGKNRKRKKVDELGKKVKKEKRGIVKKKNKERKYPKNEKPAEGKNNEIRAKSAGIN